MIILCTDTLLQTVHEGRIYQLKLFCDKDYPEKPPSVRFHSRINMTCVNPDMGVVIPWAEDEFKDLRRTTIIVFWKLMLGVGVIIPGRSKEIFGSGELATWLHNGVCSNTAQKRNDSITQPQISAASRRYLFLKLGSGQRLLIKVKADFHVSIIW